MKRGHAQHDALASLARASCGALLLALSCSNAARAQDDSAQRARTCFEQAQSAYIAGRLDEARRGFECAYALLPSAELAWNLARVFERMGDVEQGVRFFRDYLQRAARVTPRERKAVEARVAALLALRARQAAPLPAGDQTRRALGSEARAFFERGVKLYRAHQYAAAQAAFVAALQLTEAPELHYNLALTAERLGHWQDAWDHYRAYLAAQPEAPDREEIQGRIAQLRAQLP